MSLPANPLTVVTPASSMLADCPSVVLDGDWAASASGTTDKASARSTPSCASICTVGDGAGVSSFLIDSSDFVEC